MSIKQDLVDGEYWAAQQRRKMGAKRYDAWVRSQQVFKYVDFNDNWDDIEEIMEKAGYDLNISYTSNNKYIKTHFGSGKYDYFLWGYKRNKVVACFDAEDDKRLVQKFINAVEKVMGRKCFFDSITEMNEYNTELKRAEAERIKTAKKLAEEERKAEEKRLAEQRKQEEELRRLEEAMQEQVFPTVFVDENLLKQALNNSNLNISQSSEGFTFKLPDCTVTIFKEKDSNYSLKVIGKANLENVYNHVQRIESEYEKAIQKRICDNIKQKVIKSSSMQLEQEEILEDNSVLLTIRV